MKHGIAGLALFVLLVPFGPPLRAQSPDSLELATRLFERSGLAVQLRSFPAQFEGEGLAQYRGKLPDEMIKSLGDAGKESFALPALQADIVPALARRLPAADIRQTLAWLEGPVGRRMTLAEEKGSGAMTPENMQAYLDAQKAKPAGKKRVALIAELIKVVKADDTSAAFIESMALGVAAGMDATQPVEKRIGVVNLRARLRAAMPPDRLRAQLKAALPVAYGFIYREVREADLAAYVKFNGSPLGQRYNDAVTEALTEGLTRAGLRVGEIVQGGAEKKAL